MPQEATLKKAQTATAPQQSTDVDLAFDVRKAGSSFYRAMTLLAPARRDAMFALYAFCRTVDDIADDDGRTNIERRQELDLWRARIAAIYEEASGAQKEAPGLTSNGLCRALVSAIKAYAPRQEDFLAIIDGMAMDATTSIVAPDLDMLDLYCDRVASAVGRVSVHIFGDSSETAYHVAWHLGRALQLTNILRDIAEDAGRGRLYLPREILSANQIEGSDPESVLKHPYLGFACGNLAMLASDHYGQAFRLMDDCKAGTMRAARLMGRGYEAILIRLKKSRWKNPRAKMNLPAWQKAWILIRYGLLP